MRPVPCLCRKCAEFVPRLTRAAAEPAQPPAAAAPSEPDARSSSSSKYSRQSSISASTASARRSPSTSSRSRVPSRAISETASRPGSRERNSTESPRLDRAGPRDPQVEPPPPRRLEALHHLRVAEAEAELEARQARLRDDELRRADPNAVSDRELVLRRHAREGQVLAEHPPRQLAPELLPPDRVVLGAVRVDRLVRPAVHAEIGLGVARQVDALDAHRPGDRLLEDRRRHRLPLPRRPPGQTDVDRDDVHEASTP